MTDTVEAKLSEEDRALIEWVFPGRLPLDWPERQILVIGFKPAEIARLLDACRTEARRPLERALEPFANVARDDSDAAGFDDERILRLVYDDPEWGDNTVLAEFFMRPFRKARAALTTKGGGKEGSSARRSDERDCADAGPYPRSDKRLLQTLKAVEAQVAEFDTVVSPELWDALWSAVDDYIGGCHACGMQLQVGPRGDVDCIACNPNPAAA